MNRDEITELLSLTKKRTAPMFEYIPPATSARTEPPYGSPEITRWMVHDGHRVQRHDSMKTAWKTARSRSRILRAVTYLTACLLAFAAAVAVPLGAVSAVLPAVIGAYALTGLVIAAAAICTAIFMLMPRWGVIPFLDFVRERYHLSHDEFAVAMVVLFAVLTPPALLMHFVS